MLNDTFSVIFKHCALFLFRFRCPVCNKRLAKVQNFKDHIMKKHMAPPTSQKSKFCTSCNQLIPQSSFAKHMKEFHEKVHQQFQCPHPQCTQTFAKQAYLNFHVEKHIPKSEWVWFCRLCAQPFPSEARLKSHELSSHQNDAFYCRHCDLEGIFNFSFLYNFSILSYFQIHQFCKYYLALLDWQSQSCFKYFLRNATQSLIS